MHIEIITKEDLQIFRLQLLEDLEKLLKSKSQNTKLWLKSPQVRSMLKISAGTLQNLRITGKLNPSKIGGSFYYRLEEIEKLLEHNK